MVIALANKPKDIAQYFPNVLYDMVEEIPYISVEFDKLVEIAAEMESSFTIHPIGCHNKKYLVVSFTRFE